MDASATVAGWLSFAATVVGLGSLVTQASAIQERLDPYYAARTVEHLGSWVKRQPKRRNFSVSSPVPVGPVINAKLSEGFCGLNTIGVSRLPDEQTGKATWTAVLGMYHDRIPVPVHEYEDEKSPRGSPSTIRGIPATKEMESLYRSNPDSTQGDEDKRWRFLRTQPLGRVDTTTCILMSRQTFITLLGICNGRTMFRYSDASGHRASYASYCGHFFIDWPIGAPAMAYYHPHDSHNRATDVYPLLFRVRVDRVVQMMAGVIAGANEGSFKCGFPGRKTPGTWILKHHRRGFLAAHSGRHLYNLMGGKVFDIDYLHIRPVDDTDVLSDQCLRLSLPSLEKSTKLTLLVDEQEQSVLECALDHLPWGTLSWSIHRGLKDIVVGYAKSTMDKHRHKVAATLRQFVLDNPRLFEANGWAPDFVRDTMPDMAANPVMAGSGNAGDSVRIVTDVALLLSGRENGEDLDETMFWRKDRHEMDDGADLSLDGVIALTKLFVVEWSNEFDYQMYHDLPPEIVFR